MKTSIIVLLGCLVLAACSNPSTDPLVGTWFAQVTPASADNQTVTLTLGADHSYTLVHTQTYPATSPTPGCTETETITGNWATNNSSGMMTLTLTPSPSTAQLVTTGCTGGLGNGTTTVMTAVMSGTYTLSGNTLTVGGGPPMGTTLTRR